eukprot:1159787-Pelagomonas_calceolata.AAC.2
MASADEAQRLDRTSFISGCLIGADEAQRLAWIHLIGWTESYTKRPPVIHGTLPNDLLSASSARLNWSGRAPIKACDGVPKSVMRSGFIFMKAGNGVPVSVVWQGLLFRLVTKFVVWPGLVPEVGASKAVATEAGGGLKHCWCCCQQGTGALPSPAYICVAKPMHVGAE